HYSFSPIDNMIVIAVPTTANKTPKSKIIAVCQCTSPKIGKCNSPNACVKNVLPYVQLRIGVRTHKNNPVAVIILKSNGNIFFNVLVSNAIPMMMTAEDSNKPPTNPPPGV